MKKLLGRCLVGMLCLCLVLSGAALGEETTADTQATDGETQTESTLSQSGEVYEDPDALVGETDATVSADESAASYVATASAALKVRREPDQSALGNGSIDKGDIVYILELGNEWSKVDTGRNTGYVLTKYLSDIHQYGQSQGASTETVEAPTATDTSDADNPDGFKEEFVATTYKSVVAREEMDERSSSVFRVSQYQEVTVGSNQGDWSYIRYNNSYGYVPTSSLFKWDRIDPYAGDIPGNTTHIALVFVKHTTDIREYDDKKNEVLKTVNPGSALAVDSKDENGRYTLPYWRTTGFIDESDVAYVWEVVPWDEAVSGDMIACMSTYYAVGIYTINYQGRNYNIYLGSTFATGTVVQPNETVNIYDVMGPYRASTGYHRAPIMSQTALWGYGGGLCQVNTTLYNVLIQVPIYINWRKVHANVGIYYCPVGFDAAVGGGDTTMIFTNTLPYAFRINYFISDGCLTVGIFRN